MPCDCQDNPSRQSSPGCCKKLPVDTQYTDGTCCIPVNILMATPDTEVQSGTSGQAGTSKPQRKIFNDPVHGHIELPPLCVTILDTPQFQRLRDIKQLGGVPYVYPGGSHSRFEHSIGVCHLAGRLVKALRERQPELEIDERDVLCVQIAGLCHDLGHGPLSRVFEKFIQDFTGKEWKHEKASVKMFNDMVKVKSLKKRFEEDDAKLVYEEDCLFITELMEGAQEGKPLKGRGPEKAFLYDIVANKRNGVDVDKWDYFLRDCHHVGIPTSFSPDHLVQFARVIEVDGQRQICWRDKVELRIYEMFHIGFILHRQVYQHKVVKAVEMLLVDVLKASNDKLKIQGKTKKLRTIAECIEDTEAYTKLTDGIFSIIRLSYDPNLKDAQNILEKTDKRTLYCCIAESSPVDEKFFNEGKRRELEKELGDLLKKEEARVRVEMVDFVFGYEHKNPVERVRFYSKEDPDTALPQAEGCEGSAVATTSKERVIRVYLVPTGGREKDKSYRRTLEKGFSNWCQKLHLKAKPSKRSHPEGEAGRGSAKKLKVSRATSKTGSHETPTSTVSTAAPEMSLPLKHEFFERFRSPETGN